MGLIASFGDYGVGDIVQDAQELYDLLLDLCQDKLSWSDILNKPTTRDGFGLTDVYSKTEVDDLIENAAPGDHTHDFSEIKNTPTTLAGYGITDAYNKVETDTLLDGKSDIGHTHDADEITGLTEAIQALGVQIVEELPQPVENGRVYLVLPAGDTRFSAFISASGEYIPLNAVTYQALATALATKQDKLTGTATQYVKGNGTYGELNKAAVGLGNVDNTSDADKPISNAAAAALAAKADDSEVLKKTGNQTKTSGVLTFAVSPEVPVAQNSNEAVNLGQVQTLISDVIEQIPFPDEIIFDTPAEEWTWMHNLNRKPVVKVVVGGYEVNATVHYLDNDTLKVIFTKPQTGSILIR